MSTKGIISRVLHRCPGWARSSGNKSLLKLLEQGVDELFDYDHDSMIYRGLSGEGKPPYLITTAGVYDYDVSAANLSCGALVRTLNGTSYNLVARKVKRIFVDTTDPSYVEYPFEETRYQQPSFNNGITEITISSQPAFENTAPTVKFQYDPGSSTAKYYIEVYIGAPRLTSENIQIPVPERFEKFLEEYIFLCANERKVDAFQFMEDYVKPKFSAVFMTAANTVTKATPPLLY